MSREGKWFIVLVALAVVAEVGLSIFWAETATVGL